MCTHAVPPLPNPPFLIRPWCWAPPLSQVNYGDVEVASSDEERPSVPRIDPQRLSKLLLQGDFGGIPHRLKPRCAAEPINEPPPPARPPLLPSFLLDGGAIRVLSCGVLRRCDATG